MWNEFKNFALKGSAFDLAVGVIMGAAFGKIVDSMVNHLIMPIIAAVVGSPNFDNVFIPLSSTVTNPLFSEAIKQGPVLGIGAFVSILVNFLILAFVLLQLVKMSNRMKRAETPAPPPAASTTDVLLAEIRDSLAVKKR